MPTRLSWSSISKYAECGERWRLEYGFKIPSATWFATLAGSAIHRITELADLAELNGVVWEDQLAEAPSFQEEFDKEIAEAKAASKEIKASGKQQKTVTENGGPHKKDYDWWLHYGPIYVQRWMDWKKAMGWTLAVLPDGRPGVELPFDITLGGIQVRGIIDRVYIDEDGWVTVFDLKSGEIPSGSLQLLTYVAGLKEIYGINAQFACFWSPRKTDEAEDGTRIGGLSPIVSVSKWNLARLDSMYAQAVRGIEAGVFLPTVTNMCVGCGVRDYCWAVAGDKHDDMPYDTGVVGVDSQTTSV